MGIEPIRDGLRPTLVLKTRRYTGIYLLPRRV